MQDTKEIEIYPYQCFVVGQNGPDFFVDHYSKKNFLNNEVTNSQGRKISTVIEKSDNGLLLGVFSKLKNENLWVRNEKTGEAKEWTLDSSIYLEDPTHFVWNPRTGILFADFNREGFGILSDSLTDYLSSNLHYPKQNIILKPFFIKDALRLVLDSQFAIQLYLNVTRPNEAFIDQAGFGRSTVLGEIATEGIPFTIKIGNIADSQKKITRRIYDKIVKAIISQKSNFEAANIVIDDGIKYNLLKDTYIRYPTEVKVRGKHLDDEDTFRQIFALFQAKQETIFKLIPDAEQNLRKLSKLDSFV